MKKKISKRKPALKSFNVLIEKDQDGYYFGYVPGLVGCHSQAKSIDQLIERVREAIELCLEIEKQNSDSVTVSTSPEFVGVQRISI